MPDVTTATTTGTPAAAISGQPSQNPAPVKTVTVDGDGEDLNKWAGLRRQLRETTAKLNDAHGKVSAFEKQVADAEAWRGGAEKFGTVEKLVKEGKLVEAMKATGIELETAFAQWVEENENNPAPAVPPQELIELKAKYETIEARLKAEDEQKAKDAEEAKRKNAEGGRASVLKDINGKITADGARWVRCAKEPGEASESALGVAQEKARAVITARAAAKGFDLSKLTDEQAKAISLTDAEATELFDLALDAVEAEYKALAEKFHVPEVKLPPSATVRPIGDYFRKGADSNRDSSPVAERKVAVTLDGQRGSLRTPKEQETRGKLSVGDAKAKALASVRALSRR